eukprot:GGOE01049569.1.p1 GENE.GGOE01049569.1~~GGOE01049569.1.p1  ORF type:complete len:390 (+),score=97.06 GGOE01049569.1:65-1171(+)
MADGRASLPPASSMPHAAMDCGDPLDSVQQQYLAQIPLRSFTWPSTGDCDMSLVSPASQQQVLDRVLCHPRAVAFPPSAAYTRQFVKQYISMCEGAGQEVADGLYEALAAALSADPSSAPRGHYQTYRVSPSVSITVQTSDHFIACGTTGLVTWPAAYRLAEWVLHCGSPQFAGKRVLELGSGSGLLGMLVAQCTSAAHVTLSDGHELVLDRLKDNLRINGLAANLEKTPHPTEDDSQNAAPTTRCASESNGECSPSSLTVLQLDWFDFLPATLDQVRAEIVLCSDVSYDPGLFPGLTAVLRAALRRDGAVGFVASAVRNPQTAADFLEHLRAVGLTASEVDLAGVPPRLCCDRTAPVVLHEVRRTEP